MYDALIRADHALFRQINGADWGDVWGGAFEVITWLGSGAIVVPAIALFALIAWRARPAWRSSARVLVWTFALSGALTLALKAGVDRARPPAIADELAVGDAPGVQVRGARLERRSFPSGHTQTAFSWGAAVAVTTRRRWVAATALALATLVGVSRVVLGVHFPLDVLVGAALALAAAWWMRRRERHHDH